MYKPDYFTIEPCKTCTAFCLNLTDEKKAKRVRVQPTNFECDNAKKFNGRFAVGYSAAWKMWSDIMMEMIK